MIGLICGSAHVFMCKRSDCSLRSLMIHSRASLAFRPRRAPWRHHIAFIYKKNPCAYKNWLSYLESEMCPLYFNLNITKDCRALFMWIHDCIMNAPLLIFYITSISLFTKFNCSVSPECFLRTLDMYRRTFSPLAL